MFAFLHRWIEKRHSLREAWRRDAASLIEADEMVAFYEAQLRAARARYAGDSEGFWHWAKVAVEVERGSTNAEIDQTTLQAILECDASMRHDGSSESASARKMLRDLGY